MKNQIVECKGSRVAKNSSVITSAIIYVVTLAALKFKTCVAMKFVDDDDMPTCGEQ